MVLETERLVESRRLLEAHARLMDLERWQDDILWQLHGAAGTAGSALSTEDQELVAKYFSGVGKLVDALGKNIFSRQFYGLLCINTEIQIRQMLTFSSV